MKIVANPELKFMFGLQMQDLYSSKFPDLFSTFSTQFYKVYPKWNITKKMSYSIKRVRIRDVIQESEVKRLK